MDTSARWRNWVSAKPILSLIVVAIMATQLGTYAGYVFPAFGLPTLPWPLFNGVLVAPASVTNAAGDFVWGGTGQYFAGQSMHYVNGIVFGILYGIAFRDNLPLGNTNGANMLKGLIYGVIMTIISIGVLVPYAYVPKQGYGLFLMDGPDGWKLPFGVLIWHLIYGLALGGLWQPKDEEEAA